MLYNIVGLPAGWVLCPPLVKNWIAQIRGINGDKKGNLILFKREEILSNLRDKLRVPHVADFIEQNTTEKEIAFSFSNCSQI